MHSCIFFQRSTRRSDNLHYLVLCLLALPYSGLVSEAAPPPINFTPALWRGWNIPVIVFLQGLFKRLGYSIALDFQPCLIYTFTWGLRSWGSFWGWIFLTSSEGVTKLSANISSRSRMSWIFFPVWYLRGSPLWYFHQIFDRTTARLAALILGSWLSLSSQFSWGFSEVLRRTDP